MKRINLSGNPVGEAGARSLIRKMVQDPYFTCSVLLRDCTYGFGTEPNNIRNVNVSAVISKCHHIYAVNPTLPPVLSCLVLSCPVLSCPVLACPVLSCLVLSCPVLSCLVLSCPVLSALLNPFCCLTLSSYPLLPLSSLLSHLLSPPSNITESNIFDYSYPELDSPYVLDLCQVHSNCLQF